MPDGSTQILGVGIDGNLYHEIHYPNGTHSGFHNLPGVGATHFNSSSVAIAGLRDGTSQVVAVGNNGLVYWNGRYTNGAWTGWRQITSASQTGTGPIKVAIAALPDGSTQVFFLCKYGSTFMTRSSSGAWSGMRSMGDLTSKHAEQLAAAGMPDGSTQLLILQGEEVYHEVFKLTGNTKTESGFAPMGVPYINVTDVSITAMMAPHQSGQSQIAISTSGFVYHNVRNNDGHWKGFNSLAKVPGNNINDTREVAIAGRANGTVEVLGTAG
ncbi:hypothetical protein [Streptomyces sp. NPDC126514]|uniref:hypothetical protein n=1 Tax=Streptomyces sp. NPDC126514 TaxID=3155210 RepID=UPI0033236941